MIGKGGRDIQESDADSHVAGYGMSTFTDIMHCFVNQFTPAPIALAVDMTARNVQDAVKKKGLPWSAAKGFDSFTPVGYVSRLYHLFILLIFLDHQKLHPPICYLGSTQP